MLYFKIKPILGLKTDVPQDDSSLFQFITDSMAATHDVGGQNVDYEFYRNACSKCKGYTNWSHSAVASTGLVHGMFELDDGTNVDNIIFDNSSVFYYDSSKDPVEISSYYVLIGSLTSGPVEAGETVTGDTTGTQATVTAGTNASTTNLYITDVTGGTGNFSAAETLSFSGGASANCDQQIAQFNFKNTAATDIYCMTQFGSYLIFSDVGTQFVHKWKNGDYSITPLITDQDAHDNRNYKFKYLVEWYNHIIGANELWLTADGDLSIRWTDVLPTWTDLEFPAGNQIYKPGTDPIVGLSKLGTDTLLVYGQKSISRMIYYPGSSTLFGVVPIVQGHGSVNHHSIINAYGFNWFFNRDYGFVQYDGSNAITKTISSDIDNLIRDIPVSKYEGIVGRHIVRTEELAWLIPSTASIPDKILYYSVQTGQWRQETKSAYYIDVWPNIRTIGATELITNGDMELDANWANFSTPTTNERSSTQAHAGTYSRKFVVDFAADGIECDAFATITNSHYTLKAWVYPEYSKTDIRVQVLRGSGSGYLGAFTFSDLVSDTWNYIEKEFVETAGGASAQVIFFADSGATDGTWYIDDVSVKETISDSTMVTTNNGDIYKQVGDRFDGAIYDGYRIEPIMDFGDPKRKKTLHEIWFGIADGSQGKSTAVTDDPGIDVYLRVGETAREVINATWRYIGSVMIAEIPASGVTDPPVIYIPNTIYYVYYDNLSGGDRFHIKETITGSTGSTTAIILGVCETSATAGVLYFRALVGGDGGFDNNEQITNSEGETANCVGTDGSYEINSTSRLSQIKWGTDSKDEGFTVNRIEFGYDFEDKY